MAIPERNFGAQIIINSKLCLHNITSRTTVNYGTAIWILRS